MEPSWILRTTLWEDDKGNLIQVSATVLDGAWEPQSTSTVAVGPFDEPGIALLDATRQAKRDAWWITNQLRLPI